MGQRSQIYVRLTDEQGDVHLVARYFQWCYAERLVSRARHGIEWMHAHEPYLHFNLRELNRIFDVNFDMHDIVISTDIIEEFKQYGVPLFNNANNDGKLFIEVDERTKTYKYCFTDWDNNYLGDAESYMKWELQSFVDSYDLKADLERISQYDNYLNNIEYLKEVPLMSKKELENFIGYDYDLEDKPLF